MEILKLIKEYWVILTFLLSIITTLLIFIKATIQATKCSLRNDILAIYDRCKDKKMITHYQLEAIQHSYEIYEKLNGNSFVESIVKRVEQFELID